MTTDLRSADRMGQFFTWLCGGALAVNLLLVIGLLGLIGVYGLAYFWQPAVAELTLRDGSHLIGEIRGVEDVPSEEAAWPGERRMRLKIGNRDLYGLDFRWVRDSEIAEISYPADIVLLERMEWGNFYGRMTEVKRAGETIESGGDAVWAAFPELHAQKIAQRDEVESLAKGEIGEVNYRLEQLRLAKRKAAIGGGRASEAEQAALKRAEAELSQRYEKLAARLFAMRDRLRDEVVVMRDAGGQETSIAVGEVVRFLRPNSMGLLASLRLYLSRVWEFVSGAPRESNTEGGIFPAIFGTVMMVFLMSFAVVPFGVLAALYLREYAKEGAAVRAVRIAVNNLAGVPSIVFGVFGLGFFVYLIGGTIDQIFYRESLPTPTYGTGGILWASLTLALLTVPVVIVAAEEGLAAVPRIVREGSLALGATKFETIWRVVLPAAAPGILTGMILAMARAAGEVAPLMIVGMVKLAPSLPIDHHFPFVHLERKFMHLGFHVYDVGFQSPNVEAAQPLVFATALLLVAVVVAMNLVAIVVRNRLRRAYATSAV
jgi:phosphate transport system permease protein